MEEKTHTYMNNIKGNLMDLLKEDIEDAYTLYVDMDGVLTDFDKRFKSLNPEHLTAAQYQAKNGIEKFWDFIDVDLSLIHI